LFRETPINGGAALPPQLAKKAIVELTFDEIAGVYSEEEDPRAVFGSLMGSQSNVKARIYVTQDGYDHMHWETRMRWLYVATVIELRQGDTFQSMGFKEIMVEHGHHYMLVETTYRKMLETMTDENIEWYTSVIKKAWEDRPRQAKPKEVWSLETLLHCSRQQLIRYSEWQPLAEEC
jgi:hypothetical protein